MSELKLCPFCKNNAIPLFVEYCRCSNENCILGKKNIPVKLWQNRPLEDAQAAQIQQQQEDLLKAVAVIGQKDEENERLRKGIDILLPKNGHDHDYWHDDCGLCQWEKQTYEAFWEKIGINPEKAGD